MPDRVPDPSLIVDNGPRYDRVLASRGKGYAFAYSYTGRPFTLRLGVVSGPKIRAAWYSPRDGAVTPIGPFDNRGAPRFAPPGATAPGNDWAHVPAASAAAFPDRKLVV